MKFGAVSCGIFFHEDWWLRRMRVNSATLWRPFSIIAYIRRRSGLSGSYDSARSRIRLGSYRLNKRLHVYLALTSCSWCLSRCLVAALSVYFSVKSWCTSATNIRRSCVNRSILFIALSMSLCIAILQHLKFASLVWRGCSLIQTIWCRSDTVQGFGTCWRLSKRCSNSFSRSVVTFDCLIQNLIIHAAESITLLLL